MQVKIKHHNGEICAQIPPDLTRTATQVRGGRYDPGWKCWRFPDRPHIAEQLLAKFRDNLGSVDTKIRRLASEAKEARKCKEAVDLPDIPGIKLSAWGHQRRAYHFTFGLAGAILAMSMGTGKSLTAIGLISNRPHDMVLIVAPKSVCSVWPSEFKKHAQKSFLLCCPNKGTVQAKTKYIADQHRLATAKQVPFVLIVNYDAFWRDPLAKWIKTQNWDQIVFDEIHRIKSPKGKASNFACKLTDKARFRLGLTGTLLPHSPLDAFAQYKAVDSTIFGKSFFRFKQRFALMGGFGGKQVVGFQNEAELNAKIESIAYQIGADVLDLPEAIHSFRTCELKPKTRKMYDQLDSDLYAQIDTGEITVANAMVKVLRLQQLTSGYLKTDDGELVQYGDEKLKLFEDLLGEIPQSEPVVVFCRFTSDIENVRGTCEASQRTCGELSGQGNDLAAWQAGEIDCLAVQIRSGGVGIDLTRAAYCVYYSMGHSLGDYQQSLARTHRPGQTRTVRYYHLLAEGTVDPTIYSALRKKQEVVEYILAGIKEDAHDLEG